MSTISVRVPDKELSIFEEYATFSTDRAESSSIWQALLSLQYVRYSDGECPIVFLKSVKR